MIGIAPCAYCKHRDFETFGHGCAAFPDRVIPAEILRGSNPHRDPFPGDHGIRFEPRDEEAQREYEELFPIEPEPTG